MSGETASVAMFSRRLVKDYKAGEPLDGTIEKMNKLIEAYTAKSRPSFCAQQGMVDEIVDMPMLRNYIHAFTNAAYQNPRSICAMHQMLTPRVMRDFETFTK